jgi:hypothetical protein
MPATFQTTIQCVQCRQPFRGVVQTVIDPTQNPQAKISLLGGTLNQFPCPNCGTPNGVLTPILYHDGSKELMITYVPMELGMTRDAQEKAIGDLIREVTAQLPKNAFKAYLLQPRSALTMQGLIEQVLQADGVTPEMMEAQRERVRLVEMFIQTPPELLAGLIQQYDAKIDAQFMQTMTLVIQQLLQEGRQPLAEQVAAIQNYILENSTFGEQVIAQAQQQEAVVAEVAETLSKMGETAQRSDFMKLAIDYAGDEQHLQALVGLARPAFDATFFQELNAVIGKVPASSRAALEALRDHLSELTAMVDQQAQMALQEAATLLRVIASSPNPDEIIRENLGSIDYTFLQLLTANIQEATRRGDVNGSSKLKDIYNRIIAALQANMPPELQFINDLLSAPSDDVARQMVVQGASSFGHSLLEAMDAVEQQLTGSGNGNPALLERLAQVRQEAVNVLR